MSFIMSCLGYCEEQRVDTNVENKQENYLETKRNLYNYRDSKNHTKKTIAADDGSYILSLNKGNCAFTDTENSNIGAKKTRTGKQQKNAFGSSCDKLIIPKYA